MKTLLGLVLLLFCVAAQAQGSFEIGGLSSAVAATGSAATPGFSPGAGTYGTTQTVTLSTSTSGCSGYIVYNLTGTSSGGNLTGTTTGTSVSVASTETVYAQVQSCPSYTNSGIGSAAYTIVSVPSPVLQWNLCGDITALTGCVPTTSTVAYDSGTSGSNGAWAGTQSGTSFWYSSTAFPLGYTGVFDGTDNQVSVANNSSIQFVAASYTVVAWVNPTSLSNSYNALVDKGIAAAAFQNSYIKSNGKIAVYIENSAGTSCNYDGSGSNTLVTGTWYMFAYTVTYASPTLLKGYINGNLDGSATCVNNLDSGTGNTAGLYAGQDNAFSGRRMHGLINRVQLYSGALTQPQLAAIYSAGH